FAALTRAMGQMLAWLAEHDADELAETTAPFFPDVARDVLASAFERYRQAGIWARTPDVSRQGFARLGEGLLSGGFTPRMQVYEGCVAQGLGSPASSGSPAHDNSIQTERAIMGAWGGRLATSGRTRCFAR